MLLALVSIALAINECQREQDTNDLPCRVFTEINTGTCPTTQYTINGTTANWESLTSLCFFTFNYTTPGVYYYNSSIATGLINLEEKNMVMNSIILYLGLFLIILILYVLMHTFKEDGGTPTVYAVFAGALNFILVGAFSFGFIVFDKYSFYLIILHAVMGVYSFWIASQIYKDIQFNKEPEKYA